ncbi:MAG: hypothetical protein JNL74_07890 [Fibrobacteres bacterium]|nr:hypothetical protein [Fibrobacterota bacterium]
MGTIIEWIAAAVFICFLAPKLEVRFKTDIWPQLKTVIENRSVEFLEKGSIAKRLE